MAQDAIALLKADHRKVKQLFRDFERAGERAHATQRRLVERITEELVVHAGIEEAVFYPQVRRRIDASEDEVLESLEEHHVVKMMLSELEGMDPKDERFRAKVTVLIENVEHHIGEEERELFPEVRRGFTRAELVQLGGELETARSTVPSGVAA
ncbi:MAG TPA: hemerythrin domain-containing protein [Candidatus Dormibacteraeota bacterium]|nr:hemerythrin domain-containing protein [Candidatus Dormibacteraeota bacterium]